VDPVVLGGVVVVRHLEEVGIALVEEVEEEDHRETP